MSSEPNQVEFFLGVTQAVVNLASCLDEIDKDLINRAQELDKLKGDFRNRLVHYSLLLSELFKKEVPNQITDIAFISKQGLFIELGTAIIEIPSDFYAQAMITIAEGALARLAYFEGVRDALPCGRIAHPADIAWFHRTTSLVKQYKEAHPSNAALFREETPSIKKMCDFRAFKMELVSELKQANHFERSIRFFSESSKLSSSKISNLSNFLAYYLHEPAERLAQNQAITTYETYLESIDVLEISFSYRVDPSLQVEHPKFKEYKVWVEAYDPELTSICSLSEEEQNSIKSYQEKTLKPIFTKLTTEIRRLIAEQNTASDTVSAPSITSPRVS